MHIPDGFLNAPTCGSFWAISVGTIGYALRKLKAILKEKMIPLMGISSAFIFAAQMLNFPITGGTSGHLIGGVLAAVLLGPWGGMIVISAVLIVQCLIFQDGGLTALGANVFNMAIIGSGLGYLIYAWIRKHVKGNKGIITGSALASWASVVLASLSCAIQLGISGTSPFKLVIPAMVGIHALIGIGEALITSLVVLTLLKVRPDLIYNEEGSL